MLTKRQQQVLKAMVDGGNGDKYPDGSFANGLWWAGKEGEYTTFGASSLYALAHQGLVAFTSNTTVARAKEIRPIVERFVSIAKRKTLASRRILLARMKNEKVVSKLVDEVAGKYATRSGGYLRIQQNTKMRKRDGSRVATIEFV
jgi:large subunit ribosomal protein L17